MYLTTIIGDLGSGKTTLMTYYALLTKRDVWSNYNIYIPNYHELKQIHLAENNALPNHIVICIDEIYAWLESRLSGRDINISGSHVIMHGRKIDSDVFCTTPLFSTADKRVRLMSNVIITAQPRLDENDDFNFEYWYTRYDSYSYFTIPYIYAEKYIFPKFDTLQKIESFGKGRLEFNIIRQTPSLLLEKIIDIYDELSDQFNGNITHDSVETVLLLNGYYTGYKKYLYLYAKKKLSKVKGVKS